MSDYDIYRDGRKIGEIREQQNGCANAFAVIIGALIIAAIAGIFSFFSEIKSNREEAKLINKVNSSDSAYVVQVEKYVQGVKDEIDIAYELAWMEDNYPDVKFNFDSWLEDATLKVKSGIPSYDGSVSSLDSSYFCNQPHDWSQNYGDFLTLKLDKKYNNLTGTVYLSKDEVTSYLREEDNYFYNHPDAEEYKPLYDDSFGLCVVFVDNKVVYESPVLRPYGTLSDKMSINISGGSEIVICIVGLAYLGSSMVAK